jgi:outer membrane cobalamin receptor
MYAGGRKALHSSPAATSWSVVNMKDINELNFRGEYIITDWVSVNARLNNILFRKYELQYGYALQGFSFLGGVSFKF